MQKVKQYQHQHHPTMFFIRVQPIHEDYGHLIISRRMLPIMHHYHILRDYNRVHLFNVGMIPHQDEAYLLIRTSKRGILYLLKNPSYVPLYLTTYVVSFIK
jgi:hypothetical protein